jgi:hypothetical protein
MKRIAFATILAAMTIATVSVANAGDRDPRVNARQHNQQERIRQGVRSGELTGHEARKLEREERGIRKEERQDKADGHLSAAERKDLHQDLNQSSRDIYQQKHDAQERK